MGQESTTTLKASEFLKLLAAFGEIELEDVVIKARKITIRPLRRKGAE